MKKRVFILGVTIVLIFMLTSCGKKDEKKMLSVLAAASLTDAAAEIEELYEKENPDIDLVFSFGGSGALRTQIEEGADADIFFSAAVDHMDKLKEKGLVDLDSVTGLLENSIVLIVPKDNGNIKSFSDLSSDKVKMVGIGEPESVPAGKYALQVFKNLGLYDAVKDKFNYGQDVRTVLTWVEEESVDCGVVYATDAYTSAKVVIVSETPEGTHDKVIYPVAVVSSSKHPEEAKSFLEFLKSDKIAEVFAKYGFTKAE
ncbi:MAG: molybdate ABC transporter substrate-binding protein [Lachnospiraceae bacterium]|nr:molybdate ABC transporter substrate-binding protein [Lachnospiraceae bacterium]